MTQPQPPPRGVNPADAATVLKTLLDVWEVASDRMLGTVAKRLARGITEQGWAEAKARQTLAVRDELTQITSRLHEKTPAMVVTALEEAYEIGRRHGSLDDSGPGPALGSRPHVVQRLAERLTTQLHGTHVPVIRAHLDVYQKATTETEMLMQTGTMVRREAIAQTVDQLITEGHDRFEDKSGRSWHLDTYARMAGRSIAGQCAVQGQLDEMQAEGRDLVLVSDSPRECQLCRPFESQLLSIGGATIGETHEGQTVDTLVQTAVAAGLWHPNCFPASVVAGGPTPELGYRRWYEGDLVTIHTASGVELPVTPNHPILTPEGWVEAGSLHVGQQVIQHGGGVEGSVLSRPDDVEVPARIGDVVDALGKSLGMSSVSVPASPEQFHGDGIGHGHVDIEGADRLLLDRSVPAPIDGSGEVSLLGGSGDEVGLLGGGSRVEFGVGADHATHSIVGSVGERAPLVGSHPLCPAHAGVGAADAGPLSLASVRDYRLADPESVGKAVLPSAFPVQSGEFPFIGIGQGSAGALQSMLANDAGDDAFLDVESGSDVLLTLAGEATAEDIVFVDRHPWHGHVYNLQTGPGWYTANGLVVHNCTHRADQFIPGLTDVDPPKANPEGYQQQQELRRLERTARDLKRRLAAAEQFGDTATTKKLKQRIKANSARIKAHTAATGQLRKRDREVPRSE